MYQRDTTTRIIFHHSLTDEGTVESIRNWHMAMNGWADIGYHFVIRPNGEIQRGRHILKAGAHAKRKNHDSIGVCLIGDFKKYEPTYAQMQSVVFLVHDISHTIVTGWEHPLKIAFHRPWWMPNACPGKRLNRKDFVEIAMRGYL